MTSILAQSALAVYTPQAHHWAKAKAHERKMQDLEQSFKAQLADYENFHRPWDGSAVVLAGGSSAGKSTIIKALKNLDSRIVEEGSDLTGANSIYEFMETNHGQFGVTEEDWRHLHEVLEPRPDHWHIHEAVSKEMGANPTTYGFKPGTSAEDQERAIKTAGKLHGPVDECAKRTSEIADDLILNKVLGAVKSGKHVAFDMCNMDKIAQHPISQRTRIKSVFVYCPFDKLTERLAERNRKAIAKEIDPSEVRAGTFPLIQYAELVRPKQPTDRQEDVIETVNLAMVKKRFHETFDAAIEVMKKTPEGLVALGKMEGGLQAKRAREEQTLLTAFGFTKDDPDTRSIDLVTRRQYDLRIDTSDPQLGTTPAERANTAALRILRGF